MEEYKGRYREAEGGLLWMANTTRPNIPNAVREVARREYDPSVKHWGGVMEILQYLKRTREMNPTFREVGRCRLEAFSYGSYAEDKDIGLLLVKSRRRSVELPSCGRLERRPV